MTCAVRLCLSMKRGSPVDIPVWEGLHGRMLDLCCCAPAGHDPNDYEIGKRVGLPTINIMNKDGSLNAAAGD